MLYKTIITKLRPSRNQDHQDHQDRQEPKMNNSDNYKFVTYDSIFGTPIYNSYHGYSEGLHYANSTPDDTYKSSQTSQNIINIQSGQRPNNHQEYVKSINQFLANHEINRTSHHTEIVIPSQYDVIVPASIDIGTHCSAFQPVVPNKNTNYENTIVTPNKHPDNRYFVLEEMLDSSVLSITHRTCVTGMKRKIKKFIKTQYDLSVEYFHAYMKNIGFTCAMKRQGYWIAKSDKVSLRHFLIDRMDRINRGINN